MVPRLRETFKTLKSANMQSEVVMEEDYKDAKNLTKG